MKCLSEVMFICGIASLIFFSSTKQFKATEMPRIRFTSYPQKLYDPSAVFKKLAVSVGSNAQFTDASNTVWEADKQYEAGSWGYVGNDSEEFSSSSNVLNTLEDPLYQTMRKGLSAYRFDVADGDYEIELRFVETEFKEENRRVFAVSINGQLVIERLDLAKEYKTMQPVTCAFRLSAKDGLGINIEFASVVGQPVLSGVHIRRRF